MKISIVTSTYNHEKLLPKLLASFASQQEFIYEWILCDDGSSDDTWNLIKKYAQEIDEFAVEGLQQTKKGVRYASSINNGLKRATGDIIFIVNGDSYLKDDTLRQIKSNYIWGTVGSALRENVDKYGRFLSFDWRIPNGNRDIVPVHHNPNPWSYLTGNGMIIDRRLFEKVGYFDDAYTGYGREDWDFFMRCAKAGIPLYQYNNVRIMNLLDEPVGGKPDNPDNIERFEKKLRGEL